MNNKFLKAALIGTALTFAAFTNVANAGLISGSHTTDGGKTVDLQGLDWLSFEHTAGLSRNDVESGFTDTYGTSWDANYWRYATRSETEILLGSLWDQKWDGWSGSNFDGANWFLSAFSGLGYDTGYGTSRVDGKRNDSAFTNHDYTNFFFGADKECNDDTSVGCFGQVAATEQFNSTIESFDVTEMRSYNSYCNYCGDTVAGHFMDQLGLNSGRTDSNATQSKGRLGQDWGSLLVKNNLPTPNSGSTSVPEPSTLAIFALGIMGLASRRFKKKA